MKNILTKLKSPAFISLLLVLPFMFLELVNRRNFNEGFPAGLFGLLWLVPVMFLLILMPILRDVRAGTNLMLNPILFLSSIVLLVLLAWMWTGLLIDQLPCFLGVPNCD